MINSLNASIANMIKPHIICIFCNHDKVTSDNSAYNNEKYASNDSYDIIVRLEYVPLPQLSVGEVTIQIYRSIVLCACVFLNCQ